MPMNIEFLALYTKLLTDLMMKLLVKSLSFLINPQTRRHIFRKPYKNERHLIVRVVS